MNKHDSERICGLLETLNYKESKNISDADLVIYYTCCVRKSADDKFYGQLSSTKFKNSEKVAVGGCLAQKESKKLLERFKQIDFVFGTQNLKDLPNLLANLNGNRYSKTDMQPEFNSDLPFKRESEHKAWVAINRGCDNHCTYCVVPQVRGKEVSRKHENIISEIKTLADENVIDITLLGQNVNSYGKDLYNKPSFSSLLEKVSKTSIERIRFTTSHPKDLSEDIILVIKECENVCEHIHLPFQAGSDVILKKMGRNYSKKHYLSLISMIRRHLPKASITTDIMVGFPGETETDFNETLDLVEKSQFDQAFTFIYSKREGTPAASLKNHIDYQTKLKRFEKLVKLQNKISLKQNKKLEGATVDILVEETSKKDNKLLTGRTKTGKLVHFKSSDSLIGKIVYIKILEAKPFFLIGDSVE